MNNAEIHSITETFASDLAQLVRRAALDAVKAALGPSADPAPEQARRSPRKRAASITATPSGKKTAKPKLAHKRDPAEIEKLTEQLYDCIKKNPGQGMEHIRVAMAVEKKDLALPMARLISARRIVAKGVKRSTRYTVVVGGLVLLPKKGKAPTPPATST